LKLRVAEAKPAESKAVTSGSVTFRSTATSRKRQGQ
jgi:hypothetical protein